MTPQDFEHLLAAHQEVVACDENFIPETDGCSCGREGDDAEWRQHLAAILHAASAVSEGSLRARLQWFIENAPVSWDEDVRGCRYCQATDDTHFEDCEYIKHLNGGRG